MKLTMQNLGVLDQAELDMGDLTVVCGCNNTGKTYATYVLYGLLAGWRFLTAELFEKMVPTDLWSQGKAEIDLQRRVVDRLDEVLTHLNQAMSAAIPDVLAGDPARFQNAGVALSLQPPPGFASAAFQSQAQVKDQTVLTMTKAGGTTPMQLALVQSAARGVPRQAVAHMVADALQTYTLGRLLPRPFLASTERTGATIFQAELNFSRNRLIELLSKMEAPKKVSPGDLFSVMYPEFGRRYALPVRDNVEFVNELATHADKDSYIAREHSELLDDFRDIIGGSYKVVRGTVHFVPTSTPRVRLTMGESSSAVRSLLDIGFYLRHRANKGDLLMIDEPELNLHPANQRRVARLLARVVNAGIKVFIEPVS